MKPQISTRKDYSPTETKIHLIMDLFPIFKHFTLCPRRDKSHLREEGRLRGALPNSPNGTPHQSNSAGNYLGEVSYKVSWVIIQNVLNGPFWGRCQR